MSSPSIRGGHFLRRARSHPMPSTGRASACRRSDECAAPAGGFGIGPSLRIRPSGGHHRCRRRVSLADRPAGNLYVMQVSLPYLRPRGGGTIVNFGSSTAIEGNAAFGAYAMAKEAIRWAFPVSQRGNEDATAFG